MMTLFTFTDGLLFSIISIGVVLLLITLIILAVSPLKKLSLDHNINNNHEAFEKKQADNTILDDDMMVAALVAAIDYRETLNKEPYLKSIKEIKHENKMARPRVVLNRRGWLGYWLMKTFRKLLATDC